MWSTNISITHSVGRIDGSVTPIVEWSVDLLWHKHILHFCTNTSTVILKGHEPLPGTTMDYGI